MESRQCDGTIKDVSLGMWQYLLMESKRRGISIHEMYSLEQDAIAEIDSLGITDRFLDYVTQHSINRYEHLP